VEQLRIVAKRLAFSRHRDVRIFPREFFDSTVWLLRELTKDAETGSKLEKLGDL
jgi:hypothetical protein